MDIDEATSGYPTLERFTKETGITVDYVEAIDGNETFFTANLAGPLGAGLPTEWDLIVMTDWMIARLIRLGWLETIERDLMPNFSDNLLDDLPRPVVRPEHEPRRAVSVGHDRADDRPEEDGAAGRRSRSCSATRSPAR